MKVFVCCLVTISLFFESAAMADQSPLIIVTGPGELCGSVIIAQEKGFFKEYGLTTITKSLKREKSAFQTYEQGNADIAVHSSIHLVRSDFDASRHLIIGTVSYSDNQMKLLARKSAGITNIADLKGKKIALPPAGFAHFFLEKLLLFNGMTLDDVEEVFVSKKDIPNAIQTGLADSTINHGVPIEKTKEVLGDDYVIFQNPAIHRKTNQLLVPREWVEKNREQAKGMLRAILKAEKFIKTNTEECIEIIARVKKYNIEDMARAVRNEMDFHLSLKQSIFNELEGMEVWALDNNIVSRKTPRNYFKMVDYSLLEEIAPERVTIIR